MKLIRSLALAVVLTLSFMTIPAMAANDSGIAINTVEPIAGGPGTFTTVGIANNGSPFCLAGIVESTTNTTTVRGKTVTLYRKTFNCSDGSGSFVLDVSAGSRPSRPSSWTVVGGTGQFTALWGSGSSTTSTDLSTSASKLGTLTGNFHFR